MHKCLTRVKLMRFF